MAISHAPLMLKSSALMKLMNDNATRVLFSLTAISSGSSHPEKNHSDVINVICFLQCHYILSQKLNYSCRWHQIILFLSEEVNKCINDTSRPQPIFRFGWVQSSGHYMSTRFDFSRYPCKTMWHHYTANGRNMCGFWQHTKYRTIYTRNSTGFIG